MPIGPVQPVPLQVPLPEPPPLLLQGARSGGAVPAPRFDCPPLTDSRPWTAPEPRAGAAIGSKQADRQGDDAAKASLLSGGDAGGGDYRQLLKPTAAGWPVRSSWCVWIEPLAPGTPASSFEARWQRAVEAALATWQGELPIQRVATADQAQVRLWRRRPPLKSGSDGALRASHGRALLELRQVQRLGQWQLEPLVEVLISPGQRPEAIQATSLHELGHAFGLWGHSDQDGDVMAVSPTARPLLSLSPRDRATLRWLLRQPGLAP